MILIIIEMTLVQNFPPSLFGWYSLDALCTIYYVGTIFLNLKREGFFFNNLNFKALNNLIQYFVGLFSNLVSFTDMVG